MKRIFTTETRREEQRAKSELTEVAETTESRGVSRVDVGVGSNGPDGALRGAGKFELLDAAEEGGRRAGFRPPVEHGGTSGAPKNCSINLSRVLQQQCQKGSERLLSGNAPGHLLSKDNLPGGADRM
jgi:hypothetical protein